MQAAPLPPLGAVPLSDKRRPSEVLIAEDPNIKLVCATTRATNVDVSELQKQLLALPEERWSEEYQKTHNVSLRRPFHDKVGVNKIICIFSDNHLESVYMLPEWENWKMYITPILNLLAIPMERVVRCLFARMPPKTLIPPHHDNGPWVARTHRIHVPLVTFPEVEFKSGREESTMERYAFDVGTVIELNNAAKHSVYNGADEWRIHMIFDILEDTAAIPTFTTLKAGQLCRQVRGRVELVSSETQANNDLAARQAGEKLNALKKRLPREAGEHLAKAVRHFFIEQIDAREFLEIVRQVCPFELQPEVFGVLQTVDPIMATEAETALREMTDSSFGPSYCILGVQKCGTTSLYRQLGQHPLVLNGKRREPHFFDWSWQHALAFSLSQEQKDLCDEILKKYNFPDVKVHDNEKSYSTHEMRSKYLLCVQAPLEKFESSMLLADSTPSYLLYGEPVALRFKQLLPHTRFIVMLRNPVQRAYSHFQMTADTKGTPMQLQMRKVVEGKSFNDIIDEDLNLVKYYNVNTQSLASFQEYANSLPQTHGCHSYLGRGLYALQLQIWFNLFPRDQFLILNIDDMDTPQATQAALDRACKFLRLPPFALEDSSRQNTREYIPMDPAIEARLKEFYAPHNQALANLLPDFKASWLPPPTQDSQ